MNPDAWKSVHVVCPQTVSLIEGKTIERTFHYVGGWGGTTDKGTVLVFTDQTIAVVMGVLPGPHTYESNYPSLGILVENDVFTTSEAAALAEPELGRKARVAVEERERRRQQLLRDLKRLEEPQP